MKLTRYTFNIWHSGTGAFSTTTMKGYTEEEARESLREILSEWIIMDVVKEKAFDDEDELCTTFE